MKRGQLQTRVVGFDLGKRRVAMAVPSEGIAESLDLRVNTMARETELRLIREWVDERTTMDDLPVIENVFLSGGFRRNPSVTISLAETMGAIRSAHVWGGRGLLVTPTSWKAGLLGKGNGNATKETVRRWLEENHAHAFDRGGLTEDEIDAWCVGLYGEQLLREEGLV